MIISCHRSPKLCATTLEHGLAHCGGPPVNIFARAYIDNICLKYERSVVERLIFHRLVCRIDGGKKGRWKIDEDRQKKHDRRKICIYAI